MVPYTGFKELAHHEVEGQDFRIRIELRDPRVLIMAPHGGSIEPTTEIIAEAIAGKDYSLYSLEGLKGDSRMLHIESHLFDEPCALKAIEKAEIVVSVHGQIDQKDGFVMIGGLNTQLGLEIEKELERAGFQIRPPKEGLMGTDPMNICNRGRLKQGTQLEISRKVRDLLRTDEEQLQKFSNAIRKAIHRLIDEKGG